MSDELKHAEPAGFKQLPSDSQADRLLRLVHWTSAASRHLRRRVAEVAEAFDLSDTELLVVWLCSGGGRIQVDLAGAIGISPAQMSGMVERLRSRDLVAMHRLAMDRRRQVWRTTAAGQTLLSNAAGQLNDVAACVSGEMRADEQDAAQALCERLAETAAPSGRKTTLVRSQESGGGSMRKNLVAAMLLAVFLATGCSRSFYRRQADVDGYSLVREKATHPHWRLPNYTISVDPRSRMYDPYAIDCPPMPPDDPTAHQFMHCVDNKRGWPFWHDNGDRPYVENPAWPEYVNIDDRGVLKLSVDDAVRLALLHSRDYQQQTETLYLSALDVSFERFRFDSQFFAGYSVFGNWIGPEVFGNSSSTLTASTVNRGLGGTGGAPNAGTGSGAGGPRWAVSKAFSTGGQLVTSFANQLVWQFSGQDNFTPTTVLDFALVQPLLRGAGRDRVLEQLTRAERTLLYNVRIMEQYRQAFYVDTAVGGGTNNSTTQRAGGVQGQGLTGFSGVGATGFGNVVTQGGGGGTAAAQGAQNFIGLLQQQRLIRNREDAIRRIRRNLVILEATAGTSGDYARGVSDGLQVSQTRQQLLTNETQLVNQRNQYQQQLDQFKVSELSLPPHICVEPTDHRLDKFDLIDQQIIRLQEDWTDVLIDYPDARTTIPERIQTFMEMDPNRAAIAISGGPTGGSYTLSWNDSNVVRNPQRLTATTAPLRWDATAGEVQAALRTITNLETARVESIGTSPNFTHIVSFANDEIARDFAGRVSSESQLTGGCFPMITAGPSYRARRYAEMAADLQSIDAALEAVQSFTNQIATTHLDSIGKDVEALKQAAPGRRARLARLNGRIEELLQTPCALLPLGMHSLEGVIRGAKAEDMIARFDASLAEAQRSLEELRTKFNCYNQSLIDRRELIRELLQNQDQTPEELFQRLVRGVLDPAFGAGEARFLTIDVVDTINRSIIELPFLQARARTEIVELEEIDLAADHALDLARRYRRDWMNQRANLVDRWRLLQFNADQLQAAVDVFFSGSMTNVNDNPFSLRSNAGVLRAGIQFDAPITRLGERNAYRQSLIEYQQARRNFYNFEDAIGQTLRGQLRSIMAFQINFDLNRLAVLEAVRQGLLNIELTEIRQRQGGSGSSTDSTAARDQGQAVSDLQNAQDNFMLIWISYEVARLQLDFAMGTMQLDNEGLWIDPGAMKKDYGQFDPWVWRGSPGAVGEEVKKSENTTKELDEKIDDLPPPFLLPPGNQDEAPPLDAEKMPQPPLPGFGRER